MLFRTFLVWAAGLPVTLFLFLFVLISMAFDRSGCAVHSIGSLWSRIILGLAGVKVETTGLENIPSKGPVIIASNHKGVFDIPVLQGYLPLQFRWVAKKELFRIPVIGWSMHLAGYIPIDRSRAGKAYRSIEAAAEKIRSGTSVLIFPEGTRNPGRGLLGFKRGGFLLAHRSGVPILPVAINGTADIMRRGSLLIRPARVRLSVGSPIDTQGLEEQELRKKTREAIETELSRL